MTDSLAGAGYPDRVVATTDRLGPAVSDAAPWLPTDGVFRLLQIPRQPADDADKRADTFDLLRQASLTAANARGTGGPVFVGWSRSSPAEQVTVMLGGFPHRERPDGSVELAYPVRFIGPTRRDFRLLRRS